MIKPTTEEPIDTLDDKLLDILRWPHNKAPHRQSTATQIKLEQIGRIKDLFSQREAEIISWIKGEMYFCTYESENDSLKCKWCGETEYSNTHNVWRIVRKLESGTADTTGGEK